MSLEHWLAFAVASQILLVIPGPTVLLVISYALGYGRRPAAAIVAGVALGDLTSITASMLGLGAILATSAEIFTVLRLAGGAYLIWLGIKLWRAPVTAESDDAAAVPMARPGRMFAHAYAVTALNPKSIVFFVAFVPQFLDAARPLGPQMALLAATFVGLATLNATLYALLAASARRTLRAPSARQAVNRVGATLLMAAGLLALGWRRASA